METTMETMTRKKNPVNIFDAFCYDPNHSIHFSNFYSLFVLAKTLCQDVQSLNQFKAKSIVYYGERKYHIEEIQLDTRGKLKITLNNKVTEVFFEKYNGTLNIAYYDRKFEKTNPNCFDLHPTKVNLFSRCDQRL